VSVSDALKGRIDVQQLTARYVFLKSGLSRYKTVAEAINYMAKFGWRPIGFLQAHCLMERIE
jgi:hypothetical protein